MRYLCVVLAASMILGAGISSAQGKVEAQERFEKGVLLFKNADFEGALVEFLSAYGAKPHFAVRYNISICLYKLHRYAEAQEEMEAYLEEGGDDIPAEKRLEIEKNLAELASLVGTLEVTCNVEGALLSVDGKPAGTLPLDQPLRLNVAEYEVSVIAEGHSPYSTTVIIPGGKLKTLEVTLQPRPASSAPREKPVPAGVFWSGMTLTVALAAGAAVTGGLAAKKHDEYGRLDFDDPDWEKTQDEGRTLVLTSNVLWGATGAVAVTTLVLAFFTDFGGKKETQTTLLKIVPDLVNPGIGIAGTF